ncbi:Rho-GTPase-activating protein 8 [Entomophthora muscae]|uniref:Rho-GTPase-activating protein 8 n=1 Tax=Entomophthora muscae TaxID=34485 RepID=A0ACC2T902_9FUNG|nr:Rho-GTPase-activating protein 8 [Entomophthora muscae]
MERNEEARIESIKAAFLNVAKIEASLASGLGPLVQAFSPHLETLKPKQDVALMVETYATGPFRPRVLLYQSQYHGPERDQSFGVNIDDQARFSRTPIPLTVSVLLKCIDEAFDELSEDDRFNVWCNEAPLVKVHSCRASINNPSPSPEALAGYDVTVLVATLRLFLLELPDSLIPGHLYETLNTACSETDDNLRWDSITSCLAELSLPQRATLNAIISRLRTASKGLQQSDASFYLLLSTYANCIMRPPPQFSAHAFHHRHPQRVLKDLLLHPEGLVSTPDDKELSDWLIASPQLSKQVSEQSLGANLPDPVKSDAQNKGTSIETISGVSEKISEDDDYLDLDLAHLDDAGQDSGAEVNLKDDFFDI